MAALEARGLIARRPDPHDGRRIALSITDKGRRARRARRTARARSIAAALTAEFTPSELEQLLAAAPLIDRLAGRL